MAAAIDPPSPKTPDSHVMLSGAAAWPACVTRPVTAPEAHPTPATTRRAVPAIRPMDLRVMQSLQEVRERI